MARPRIAILHYSAPPIIGGVESTIGAHARLLADQGYPVKILAGRGEAFDERAPLALTPLLDSKHPLVLQVNRELAAGIVSADFHALASAIRSHLADQLGDIDVCMVHNALTLHKNLALTNALYELARTGHPRFIGWSHDFAWTDPVYASELHVGMPWDLLRVKWEGVRYVVVSEHRRQELARLLNRPAETIAVVPPGLDPFEFLGIGPTARRWFGELRLETAAPLLLLPARVTRRKNIERAIEITAALRGGRFLAKLIIMGPLGPHNPANAIYMDELVRLRGKLGMDDQIIFLNEYGDVDDATRRDLYLLADALLLTSEREGFGIPILEAGAAGLPVFCSDIPPFVESAQQWAHYFASDESPDSVAERITRFLAQDARYQLKQRVLSEYAWPRLFAERIEPLLEV